MIDKDEMKRRRETLEEQVWPEVGPSTNCSIYSATKRASRLARPEANKRRRIRMGGACRFGWLARAHLKQTDVSKMLYLFYLVTCLLMLPAAVAHDDGQDSQDYATSRIPAASETGQQAGAETGPPVPSASAAPRAKAPANKPRSPALLRISESELLPFGDFNVQQPTFSDLMKSWPPTTLGHHQEPSQQRAPQRAPLPAGRARGPFDSDRTGQESSAWLRDHLNEDLDDTILTADQSFGRDQTQEPPAPITYLGEQGDFLYSQLRSIQPESDSGAPGRLELIDESLDDYFYNQYQNSHTLYYGSQLVREGDIFEIGCYLPAEQPAEWTKNGKTLAADRAASSPRVIRRTDYLGAKQNFTLKVFEASLVSSLIGGRERERERDIRHQ